MPTAREATIALADLQAQAGLPVVCTHCGAAPTSRTPLKKGRCNPCYRFFLKHGTERSLTETSIAHTETPEEFLPVAPPSPEELLAEQGVIHLAQSMLEERRIPRSTTLYTLESLLAHMDAVTSGQSASWEAYIEESTAEHGADWWLEFHTIEDVEHDFQLYLQHALDVPRETTEETVALPTLSPLASIVQTETLAPAPRLSQTPTGGSEVFRAKVQYVMDLLSQGEAAIQAALRAGKIAVRRGAIPRAASARAPRACAGAGRGRKMDLDKAREFRRRRAAGETVTALATAYGISTTLAWRIDKELYWKEA